MLTIKKSNLLLILLAVIGITILFVVSCTHKITGVSGKGPVLIELPEDQTGLAKIDHFLKADSVNLYKATFERQAGKFRNAGIHVPVSEAFNKRAILSLLKAADCVGLRIYHGAVTGKNSQNAEVRLVLVGVDSKGNDILIDRTSALTLKAAPPDMGGEEHGQCPDCLSDF